MNPKDYLEKTAKESITTKEAFLKEYGPAIIQAAEMIGTCINKGGKVLVMGNGGSAADAQHMAAEMVGNMLVKRRPLAAIALTTDTSNLTAIGNDFGYELVFVKQIEALAKEGDVVIGITTSGKSKNILAGAECARKLGCKVIGLTGGSGGLLKPLCDVFLCVSLGANSSRIQESHIFAVHSLVDLTDRFFLEASAKG
ncbi:MAG: SIS domain-containing protein [Bdellovibrio sp.]|nr:SIS domain-containing protein [Bdellovibrio sp.]